MRKQKIVSVSWIDATTHTAWDDIDQHKHKNPCPIQTVGHEIDRTNKYIKVALSISEAHGASDVITIPTGCIIKTKRL